MAGFFKGMSFPLASIAVYSSVVFGVFSNTQRLLSQLRHGDASHAPVLADVALASMVAGFVSVGIGTPVDLVKIRLQMQTQPYITGRKAKGPSCSLCWSWRTELPGTWLCEDHDGGNQYLLPIAASQGVFHLFRPFFAFVGDKFAVAVSWLCAY